jgi:ABC-type polysaccharide/polyol phosphate transport system ATPase subunit
MSDSVVRVQNISKQYQLGVKKRGYQTLRGDFMDWTKGLFSRNDDDTVMAGQNSSIVTDPVLGRAQQVAASSLWALDDVSFDVERGEVLGIIGRNGAGKSTLLKILSRITEPTRGRAEITGRMASLLEVGTGFHPELTGRQNVYFSGAVLGMKKKEIDQRLDEIVAFAELERFIDTPIKRYSSGMSVRLGFSVATCLRPDILVLDEVLAVGDLAFQRKCFDRIESLIKEDGKTVLVVSHNIRQVQRLCSRVILLSKGKIDADGKPGKICELFYQQNQQSVMDHVKSSKQQASRVASGAVEVLSVDVLDDNGKPTDEVVSGGRLRIRICFDLKKPLDKSEILVGTHTTDFLYLSASSTDLPQESPRLAAGTHEVEYVVASFPLVPGLYGVRFAVMDEDRKLVFGADNLKLFYVVPKPGETRDLPARTLDLPTYWRIDGKEIAGPRADRRTNVA